jgi:hypothetical protein
MLSSFTIRRNKRRLYRRIGRPIATSAAGHYKRLQPPPYASSLYEYPHDSPTVTGPFSGFSLSIDSDRTFLCSLDSSIYFFIPAGLDTSTLKKEAVSSSETLVNTSNIIWSMNSEDQHLNKHRGNCTDNQLITGVQPTLENVCISDISSNGQGKGKSKVVPVLN